MNLVDANVILRYLLDDGNEISEQASKIIENEEIFIPNEVIAEVVYVLEKVYKVKRKDICKSLCGLISNSNIKTVETHVISTALKAYSEKNIDIVDAILLAYSKLNNHKIFTFDKKLKKLIDFAK